jgi:tetratricopeptide (TPR) repeat protein
VNNAGHRLELLAASALLGLALIVPPALAIGPDPATDRVSPPATNPPSGQSSTTNTNKKKRPDKAAKKNDKDSRLEWIRHFWAAHALIQKGEYQAGIDTLLALKSDDHPDVATYLGYANRKLGRYGEAKFWYDKALAADPNHTRTIAYYGMWHLEQGNRLKAQDELEKIASICGGTSCRSYRMLKAALDGAHIY